MSGTTAVHQCLFCPQTFDSASEKDDHILDHFAQETCADCDQSLIRIGRNLYTQHNAVTCIKRELRTENSHKTCTTADDEYLLHDECYSQTDTLQSICEEEIEIKEERVASQECHQFDYQPDSIEAQEPEPHQSGIETNHESEHCKQEVLSQSALDIHSISCKRKLETNKSAPRSQRTNKICDVCNRTFFNKHSLDCHKVRIHSPPGTVFCTICTKIFSTADQLLDHRKECFYKQRKRVRRKPVNNRKTFELEIKEPQQNLQMVVIHHFQSLMGEMNIKIEPEAVVESSASVKYDKIDSVEKSSHVNSYQEPKTELHPKKSNENNLTASKEIFRKRCEICCQTFSNDRTLRGHKIRKHSSPDTIFCKHCARIFLTEEALLNHRGQCSVEKYQRQKRRDRVCDVCGKHFLGAINLQNHKVRKHSTPDTMFCQVCAKVFSTAEELLGHQSECRLKQRKYQKMQRIRIKGNQVRFKTLQCYLCKIVCKSKQELRSHMYWNHVPKKCRNEVPNDQRFMCTICGKYLSKNGLRSHMAMHNGEKPYKCSHEGCEKSFRCSSGRSQHMRSHTGEKPYHCTIEGCNKRFAVSLNFKQHKFKVHCISFENQHTCPVCDKIFLANYLLKKHLETHRAYVCSAHIPQTFGSAPEKDDHIIEHFAQETCVDCDQSLIRIGRNLYTQHNAVTCVKRELKLEDSIVNESHMEYGDLNYDEMNSVATTPSLKVGCEQQVDIKAEPQPETQDQITCVELIQSQSSENLAKSPTKKNSVTDRAPCDICGKSFHIFSLKRHKKYKHGGEGTELGLIECQTCRTVFQRPEYLRKHMKMKHDPNCIKFYCDFCSAVFLSSSSLDNHLPRCKRLKKPVDMNIVNCSQIEEKPTNDDKTHTQSVFYTDEFNTGQFKNQGFTDTENVTRTNYIENLEGYTNRVYDEVNSPANTTASNTVFVQPVEIKMEPGEQIEQFSSVDLGNFTETRDKDFESNQVYQDPSHSTIAPEKLCKEKSYKHKCDICGKMNETPWKLQQHKEYKHTPPGRFECKICPKVFSKEILLHKHLRIKHASSCMTFKCNHCQKSFLSKISLNNHLIRCPTEFLRVKDIHTYESKTCKLCEKTFSSKHGLQRHTFLYHKIGGNHCIDCKRVFVTAAGLRNHGPKCEKLSTLTFECFLCHKIFKSKKKNLLFHMRIQHDPNGRKFQCEICEKRFASKYDCESHKNRIHLVIRNLLCSICGRGFTSRRCLRQHENIHTGEKPFNCTYDGCDKSFRNPTTRNEHLKSHQGLKRYQCKIDGCNEQFGGRTGFRKHKFNVHAIPLTK